MNPAELNNTWISALIKQEYLLKLMASIENNNKKLYHDISNIPSRQKCFGLLTWLFAGEPTPMTIDIKKIKKIIKTKRAK